MPHVFDDLRHFYFLTFNTYPRRPLLAHSDLHQAFLKFCHLAQDRNVAVGRYVIMPDHVHLFVLFPQEGVSFQHWTRMLRIVLGKVLLTLGHDKPHWQDGVYDRLMRGREDYEQKWEYVRQNPVRAGLSSTPEGWAYQGEIVGIEF